MSSNTYDKPEDVKSPIDRVDLKEVLLDFGENDASYALGTWDKVPCILFRWNGDANKPIGNPNSRGRPTWIVLDNRLHAAVFAKLSQMKKDKAERFLGIV